jgi:hypothetical protein
MGLSCCGQVNEQEAVDREVTYSSLFGCINDLHLIPRNELVRNVKRIDLVAKRSQIH